MNALLAALLLAHAVAHLVGFAGPWRLIDPEGVTFQRALFDGRLAVSDRTLRALGIGWLILAVVFMLLAYAAWRATFWWDEAATAAAAASLAMCAAHWPQARVGAVVNVALLVGLQVGRAALWL